MNPNGYLPSLTPFSSTYQPKNRGTRKPNTLKTYISGDEKLTRADLRAMAVYLLSCPREKLQELIKDPKQPMSIVAFSSAMLGDMTSKKTTTVEILMRIIGDDDGEDRGRVTGISDNTENQSDGQQFATYEYPELKPEEELKNVTEGVDGEEKKG